MNHPAIAWLVGGDEREETRRLRRRWNGVAAGQAGRSARRARASQSPRSFRSHALFHSLMERAQPGPRTTPAPVPRAVTVRRAVADDVGALERLAALDSRPVPPGCVLVAEVDGQVEAALSLSTGEAIANPFAPTLELVRLLERRASERDEPDTRDARARLSPAQGPS